MGELTQADRYLLEQVRQGSAEGWSQLVGRHQGRLLAFAQGKLGRAADAEDLVQETFIAFLKSLEGFRAEASLETYLFTILRRKIIDAFRGRKVRDVCLLQDLRGPGGSTSRSDALGQVAGSEPTGSWYARRDELQERRRAGLVEALRQLLHQLRDGLNFRDLKIVELLFYCQLPNKEAARRVGLNEKNVAVIKHRCLRQVRERIPRELLGEPAESAAFENLLTEAWEELRLSCPKRNTIGAYLLGTLESDWQEYVEFHLNTLGCHFCRANLEDLRQQTPAEADSPLRQRILESTVGFLRS